MNLQQAAAPTMNVGWCARIDTNATRTCSCNRKQSELATGDHLGNVPFTGTSSRETPPTSCIHRGVARVVSNDDEDEGFHCSASSPSSSSSSSSCSADEIPDLTITRTRSFDEEDEIIHGHPQGGSKRGPCSLPAISEDDASDKSDGSDENYRSNRDNNASGPNRSTTSTNTDNPVPLQHYYGGPAHGLSISLMTTPQTSNSAASRSALYDEVCRLSAQCAEIQKQLEAKDDRIKEVSGRPSKQR